MDRRLGSQELCHSPRTQPRRRSLRPANAEFAPSQGHPQECTSKGIWRQGIVLKHGEFLTEGAYALSSKCPYLRTSDILTVKFQSVVLTDRSGHRNKTAKREETSFWVCSSNVVRLRCQWFGNELCIIVDFPPGPSGHRSKNASSPAVKCCPAEFADIFWSHVITKNREWKRRKETAAFVPATYS